MSFTDYQDDQVYDQDGFLLRVLVGPQSGAKMLLRPGTYIVGSGVNCDVVLVDDAAAEEQLALHVSDDEIELEALQDLTAYGEDMLLLPGESVIVSTPLAISLGLSGIGISSGDTDWTLVTPPNLSALRAKKVLEAQEADPNDTMGDHNVPDGTDEQNAAGEAEPSENSSSDEADGLNAVKDESDEKTAPDSAMRKLRAATIATLIIGLSATASGVVATGAGKSKHEDAIARLSSMAFTVKQKLGKAGFKDVSVALGDASQLVVSGYVANAAAHAQMLDLLTDIDVSFDDEVHLIDETMHAIDHALEGHIWPAPNFEEHLRVQYHGSGAFTLDGYLGPEVEKTDLKRTILGDAPGVASLTFTRSKLSDWRSIMENKITSAGLDDWLDVKSRAGMLRVEGRLTPNEAEIWRRVGQAFVTESKGWPELSIEVRVTGGGAQPTKQTPAAEVAKATSPPPPLGFNIIGVILTNGMPGRVLFDNGQSLKEGDTLDDGAVLQTVSASNVIIKRGEKSFAYYIEEQP